MLDVNVLDTVSDILDQHEQRMRLEQGSAIETRVWHLLLSLRQYCEHHDVSLDDIFIDVMSEQV